MNGSRVEDFSTMPIVASASGRAQEAHANGILVACDKLAAAKYFMHEQVYEERCCW